MKNHKKQTYYRNYKSSCFWIENPKKSWQVNMNTLLSTKFTCSVIFFVTFCVSTLDKFSVSDKTVNVVNIEFMAFNGISGE